jgi:hypothetical protein
VTDAALLAAIQADATAMSLATAGNDSGCAARMTAILPPVPAPIPNDQLLIWAASRGVLSRVVSGVSNANAAIASACLAVQASLNGGASVLDITNPAIVGTGALLDGLTSAGILPANVATGSNSPTPGSMADLIAFGSAPQVITTAQVSRCLIPLRSGT